MADTPTDPTASIPEHPALDEVDPGASASSEQIAVVENYLDWWFRRTDGKRLAKAKVLVPRVVVAAEKERLDPLLVAVMISYESSWAVNATGAVGEVGLMQVHGLATEGYDVSTLDGNLAAGCAWLASRVEKYGSLEAGVGAYIGFSEHAKRRGEFRVRAYYAERKRQGLPRSGEIS
jgi:soluble lytic murein transglycosylase-like protein